MRWIVKTLLMAVIAGGVSTHAQLSGNAAASTQEPQLLCVGQIISYYVFGTNDATSRQDVINLFTSLGPAAFVIGAVENAPVFTLLASTALEAYLAKQKVLVTYVLDPGGGTPFIQGIGLGPGYPDSVTENCRIWDKPPLAPMKQ